MKKLIISSLVVVCFSGILTSSYLKAFSDLNNMANKINKIYVNLPEEYNEIVDEDLIPELNYVYDEVIY